MIIFYIISVHRQSCNVHFFVIKYLRLYPKISYAYIDRKLLGKCIQTDHLGLFGGYPQGQPRSLTHPDNLMPMPLPRALSQMFARCPCRCPYIKNLVSISLCKQYKFLGPISFDEIIVDSYC